MRDGDGPQPPLDPAERVQRGGVVEGLPGRAPQRMPALNVVNGVVALSFGLLAFDEVPRHTPFFLVVQVLAFVAIAAGLVIVAGLEDQEPAVASGFGAP